MQVLPDNNEFVNDFETDMTFYKNSRSKMMEWEVSDPKDKQAIASRPKTFIFGCCFIKRRSISAWYCECNHSY